MIGNMDRFTVTHLKECQAWQVWDGETKLSGGFSTRELAWNWLLGFKLGLAQADHAWRDSMTSPSGNKMPHPLLGSIY